MKRYFLCLFAALALIALQSPANAFDTVQLSGAITPPLGFQGVATVGAEISGTVISPFIQANGTYSISVPQGVPFDFFVEFNSTSPNPRQLNPQYSDSTWSATWKTNLVLASATTLNLSIPAPLKIHGQVVTSSGAPYPSSLVDFVPSANAYFDGFNDSANPVQMDNVGHTYQIMNQSSSSALSSSSDFTLYSFPTDKIKLQRHFAVQVLTANPPISAWLSAPFIVDEPLEELVCVNTNGSTFKPANGQCATDRATAAIQDEINKSIESSQDMTKCTTDMANFNSQVNAAASQPSNQLARLTLAEGQYPAYKTQIEQAINGAENVSNLSTQLPADICSNVTDDASLQVAETNMSFQTQSKLSQIAAVTQKIQGLVDSVIAVAQKTQASSQLSTKSPGKVPSVIKHWECVKLQQVRQYSGKTATCPSGYKLINKS